MKVLYIILFCILTIGSIGDLLFLMWTGGFVDLIRNNKKINFTKKF